MCEWQVVEEQEDDDEGDETESEDVAVEVIEAGAYRP